MLTWIWQIIRDFLARFRGGPGRMNAWIVETIGKEIQMDPEILPVRRLFNVEKDRVRIAPTVKDRNGNEQPYSGPPPAWSSSNTEALGLDVAPDGLSAYVLTPLDNGEGVITVTASGVRDLQMPYFYAPKEPGAMNPTFGDPESDA